MFAKIMNFDFGSDLLSKVSFFLILFFMTKPVSAIEARKPEINLADQILLENKIHREEFYGDVRLLHSPNPMDVQFSEDGSVLFSQAETIRLWRSDTGKYLGSIAGPARFRRFAQLNHSRWIVTIDDREAVDARGWYWGVPQVLPHLRIWDVVTGKCLTVRRLKIPANAIHLWIAALETTEPFQATYLILEYTDGQSGSTSHCQLIGFQGRSLTQVCRIELEDPPDSLTWDSHSKQLFIHGEYRVSAFDPASNKILWTKIPGDFVSRTKEIDQLIVFDHPPLLTEKESGNEKAFSPILVTFRQTAKGPKSMLWRLIDSATGEIIKKEVITRASEEYNSQFEKNRKESPSHWTYDSRERSIKAIDFLNNKTLLRIPWRIDDYATRSRFNSKFDQWYLDRNNLREIEEKFAYSQAANRVCIIGGVLDEIYLYNSQTGKRIATASGTVSALSAFSSDKISASLDWNDVSVYQMKDHDQLVRSFHTKAPKNSCIALSADASSLLVGEASGKAQVWNLPTRKHIGTLTSPSIVPTKLLCIAIDSAHTKIVAGDMEGTFWRWKYPVSSDDKPQLLTAERNGGELKLPYQKVLPDYDLNPSLCDLSSNAILSLCFQPLVSEVYSVDIESSPGSSLVANLGYEQNYGNVIAIENAKKQSILTPGVHHKSILIQTKCSPNGRFAILVFYSGQVTIIDLQEGTLESIIQTGNREIVDVEFHPDQKTLFVASYRGTVTAWDTETFLKIGSLQLYDARLNLLSSRVAKKGFDLVLGTRDTGLIVKRGVFPKSEQQPQRPASLSLPLGGPLSED